jgi:hypothetical protein
MPNDTSIKIAHDSRPGDVKDRNKKMTTEHRKRRMCTPRIAKSATPKFYGIGDNSRKRP